MRYNPYTQSVEILSSTEKVAALVSELRGDLCIVRNALQKIHVSCESIVGWPVRVLVKCFGSYKLYIDIGFVFVSGTGIVTSGLFRG